MKKLLLLVSVLFLSLPSHTFAATFVSGSTGADGPFNPTVNTELQLPPNGIFNFTTVNIPVGVTVTFKKNAANTPVYILATGNVTIMGTIDVSGSSTSSSTDNQPGIGGPGGYDGGYGGIIGILGGVGGKGIGPGGGTGAPNFSYPAGGGGGFGTAGGAGSNYTPGGTTYGNARLIPLIGGSGGGGFGGIEVGYGGGGGGGAILIASSENINFGSNSSIIAFGGSGHSGGSYNFSGGGSGGAIKLMANTISGAGSLSAMGSGGNSPPSGGGGSGRIRIEAFVNHLRRASIPPYSYGAPGPVFVANTPSLAITSIAGVTVSSSPTASYSTPDIALPNTTTNPVTVTLSASNIPVGTTVTVSAIPQFGSAANVTATLSGTDAASTATGSVNLSTDFATVIMAYTTYPLQTAMYWEGEKIDKVRVAASMGKGSKTVYITASGKEIPAEIILAGLTK